MRRAGLALILCALLIGLSSPAGAKPRPVSRADHLAAQLRRDPVYVTDHAPRALTPDTAARIRAALGRLGVPYYVAVTPEILGGGQDSGDLVPLLRDRLRRDGLYVVVTPASTGGAARQFGGGRALPVEDAWAAMEAETAYDAGATARIERFVEIALSGRARERRDNPRKAAKSRVRAALDRDDASERRARWIEAGALGAGSALSGVPLLIMMFRGGRARKDR
ncbi:hypothetical protein [Spirillospora sp. CA-294931]|uniref:hypothetical protein n=1 Tax=Spirillospora sp. CA-294931 TaxID=3240042 RepID=UPI003D8A336F